MLTADLPDVASSGLEIDPSNVEAWEIPGVVSFASVALESPQTEVRSFVGAYFDADGAQISTAEVVYSTDNTMASWTNGVRTNPADLCDGSTAAVSEPTTGALSAAAATTTRDFCWYLNKYAEGEIALGTLVAAAGGVTALFTGPVGGAIAAAGGLKAALGGMYKWLISL